MITIKNQDSRLRSFASIQRGQLFKLNASVYIKSEPINNYQLGVGIDVLTGCFYVPSLETKVLCLTGDLHIEH